MGNFNPKLPTKYSGTNKYITFFVSRNRQPTLADYRQPETGTLYSVGTVWQVAKDPTTGVEGELWMLSKIVANEGYWLRIQAITPGSVSFQVDGFIPPGTNPVIPDINGLITVTGSQVASGVIGNDVIRTFSLAANTYDIQIQRSATSPTSDLTLNGVSHFNSDQFTVDEDGFVNLSNPGVSLTITGQTGGPLSPTSDNWNIFGQLANTTPVMQTHAIATDFYIENRSWETQYIVDPSSTIGLQGTYNTINDAMVAAIADGNASVSRTATIVIRCGTYTEDINLSPLQVFKFIGMQASETGSNLFPVMIDGQITADSNAVSFFENLSFSNSLGGDCIALANPTAAPIYFTNCNFVAPISASNGSLVFRNCYHLANLTLSGLSTTRVWDAALALAISYFLQDSATLQMYGCSNNDGSFSIDLDGEASFNISQCSGIGLITGTTTQLCTIYNSVVDNISLIGPLEYAGLVSSASGGVIISSATDTFLKASSQGNIIQSIKVTSDRTVLNTDYYTGVGNRSASVTLTLPDISDPNQKTFLNQVFIFKDESGQASTFPILIQPNGGDIDGSSNYSLTSDYEAIAIIFDGTNYFKLDAYNSSGSPPSNAVSSINVDTFTAPGSDPVLPDGSGVITITGNQVASGVIGANVLRSNSLSANTFTVEIQRSTQSSSSDSSQNGVCHFDSADFTVNADGFVQLVGSSGFIWNEIVVTGPTSMQVNNGYVTNNSSLVTLTLPSVAPFGTTIRVAGKGTGGWIIAQNAGQTIHFGALDTTLGVGGSLASNAQYDSLELLCTAADTEWTVLSSIGNLTGI